MAAELPKTMRALQYSEPRKHSLVEIPLPELRENDILVWIGPISKGID
jgi:D-arabinitol dehydrogenase (NADP+)